MTHRHALIIANPGEKGDEHYCEGVNIDCSEYKSFLFSPLGGNWYEDEIETFYKPKKFYVKLAIEELMKYDYSMVIYSGHGYYSAPDDSTIIELNKSETLNSEAFISVTKKQTVILDCCRKVERIPVFESAEIIRKAVGIELDPSECRKYYDKVIDNCDEDTIILNACGINEKAMDDSERGGLYSYNLINTARAWFQSKSKAGIDTTNNFSILTAVEAHDKAAIRVRERSRSRQNPQVMKPRSGPYFPFAVIA